MSMVTFSDASAVHPVGDHLYRAEIPDGWQQGRGAFGGLVLAVLLRAMEADEPDRRRVSRSLMGDLCGPVVSGPVEVRVRALRRGHNQSNLAAELTAPGSSEVLAAATAVLSPPRTAHAHAGVLAPPPPGSWRDIAPIPVGAPRAPTFAQHYQYRDAGSTQQAVQGWIGETEPLERLDAAALVARLDAWWPTLFYLEGAPRPVATVSFTCELLADPATLPAGEPLRYRAVMAGMNEGFFVELRELWQGGRPVALNQQTFAILK
jgi:Acyl-CoA thioesterase N-terminal domain/Acyl-CoA thioesterase C-terminal domain